MFPYGKYKEDDKSEQQQPDQDFCSCVMSMVSEYADGGCEQDNGTENDCN